MFFKENGDSFGLFLITKISQSIETIKLKIIPNGQHTGVLKHLPSGDKSFSRFQQDRSSVYSLKVSKSF